MENDWQKYLGILWHWIWLIGLGVGLSAGAAFVYNHLTPPVYRATATILINEANGSAQADPASILIRSDRLGLTYANMMTQLSVLDEVVKTLDLAISSQKLKSNVRVTAIPNTQLMQVQVEDEDPQLATTLANTLPTVFSQQNTALQAERYVNAKANLTQQLDALAIQIDLKQAAIAITTHSTAPLKDSDLLRLQSELAQLQQTNDRLAQSFENIRLAEIQSTNNIVVTELAQVPVVPVWPQTLKETLRGGVVGLVLALGLVFLIEYLDDSIRTMEQIREALDLPVIGLIAKMDERQIDGEPAGRLIAMKEARAPTVEAFRWLRTNIQIAGIDQPIRTVLVTSPGQGEGKSVVAANLAVVMAQAGRNVILLDTDLRRPAVHRLFPQSNQAGLVDALLQEDEEWSTALRPTAVEHLSTVVSGPMPSDPGVLLGSKRMQAFMEYLKGARDTIVLDTTPVLLVADVLMLAPLVDGVVLVVQHGRTSLRAAQQAVAQLREAGAHVWGVVLNQVPARHRRYGYYNYYQDHYSADEEPRVPASGKAS